MTFLLDALSKGNGPEEIAIAFQAYTAYLESIRHALPKSAYDFAAAPWHYDYTDHRCPHDSWLESLTISEPALGSRKEIRHVDIVLRLLGAFHDGALELSYSSVSSYSFSGASGIVGNGVTEIGLQTKFGSPRKTWFITKCFSAMEVVG
jgi:hypothetical protein